MTETEHRIALAKEEYRTAWIEASYIVAGWWTEKPPEEDWKLC